MGMVCFFIPTKENCILFFWLFTCMEKLPLISDTAELMIRPLASSSTTVAPVKGPISSEMVPWTLLIWAIMVAQQSKAPTSTVRRRCDIVLRSNACMSMI